MRKKISLVLAIIVCFSFILGAQAVQLSNDTHTTHLSMNDTPVEDNAATAVAPLSVELQAKEDEALKKYNAMFAYWAYDPQVIDDVNADYPAFFGGSYIDENKDLVIQVTTLDDTTIQYFSEIIDLENVVFQEVKYSYSELQAAKDEIMAQMNAKTRSAAFESVTAVGISLQNNSVNLYVAPRTIAANTLQEEENLVDSITTFENVIVTYEEGTYSQFGVCEPGKLIINMSNQFLGSVGFWAYDRAGNSGVVTAGHLVKANHEIMIDNQYFGVAYEPVVYDSVDASFIRKSSSATFSPSRFVSGWGFTISSVPQVLAVGASVYSKGAASGPQSGVVLDTAVSVDGMRNFVKTSISGAEGDSGGIVAGGGTTVARYNAGIIAGGIGSNMIYVKTGNILSALGVTAY